MIQVQVTIEHALCHKAEQPPFNCGSRSSRSLLDPKEAVKSSQHAVKHRIVRVLQKLKGYRSVTRDRF